MRMKGVAGRVATERHNCPTLLTDARSTAMICHGNRLRRCGAIALLASCSTLLQAQEPPAAPRRPVTDRYPGLTVVDPYRWMEQDGSRELSTWLTAQDRHLTSLLDRMPGRAALAARVATHVRPDDGPRRMRRGGDRLFYLRKSRDDAPATLRWFAMSSGEETAITTAQGVARHDPAPGGAWLAITAAESAPVRVIDVARGTVADSLPRGARFSAWLPDGRSIAYQQGRQIMIHQVGAPRTADRSLLSAGIAGTPRWAVDDAVTIRQTADGTLAALLIARDDAIRSVHLVALDGAARPRGRWHRVTDTTMTVGDAQWHGQTLYALVDGAVLAISTSDAGLRRDTVATSTQLLVQSMAVAADGLYLLDATGGLAALHRWNATARMLERVALPLEGSGRALYADAEQPGVVLPIDRWLGDGGWYRLTPAQQTRLRLTSPLPEGLDAYIVERHTVTSTDGTAVPLTMIRRRDLLPSTVRATWVMAYGADGIAMTPLYQSLGAALRPFLDDGGVYVVAHVRGGGEYGEGWHNAGRERRKPNGYRDLIAAGEWLIARQWATAATLVVEGASGGGATVGMAALMRPELFRVALTHVPDANTLRLHATPDGPYMLEEWGNIKRASGVQALNAMDLLQHARSAGPYPAWFASTGLLDTSVPPWMPAKLVAQLQYTSKGARPVVLRVHPEDGHVPRPAPAMAQTVDALSFVYWQLGRAEFQPTGVAGAR